MSDNVPVSLNGPVCIHYHQNDAFTVSLVDQSCLTCLHQDPDPVRHGYGTCKMGNGHLPSCSWCGQWNDGLKGILK